MGDRDGVAALEVTFSVTPSVAAEVLTFVQCVVSAVTLVEMRLAAKVPTREGAIVVSFSDVLL